MILTKGLKNFGMCLPRKGFTDEENVVWE